MLDALGSTALMAAAVNNSFKCLDRLLTAGSDTDKQRNKDGITALMIAVEMQACEGDSMAE